ncbi:MAG: PP2C family protein-serine/threonine phosphatase [Candidatus Kapabacteria bacterium]|nr:PP2C family protein-serine/threonine phosphatase [Ignavibacteriota bacterium]MCW5884723.1 PP2C family protein-serine/threonine phosphatase [Candidatus Kapabacteria bacterium]
MANNSIININSLLNLTASLYRSDDENFILNSTLLSLMGKLKIIRSAVFLKIEKEKLFPAIIKGNLSVENIEFFDIEEFSNLNKESKYYHLKDIGVEYLIPVKDDEDFYALICLGKSFSAMELSDDEIDYVNLISKIAANSIRNARTLTSYKSAKMSVELRNQLLSTLFEVSKDFSQNFSAEKIIKTLALNLMGQLTVSRFAVIVIDENGNKNTIVNRFNDKFNSEFLEIISQAVFACKIEALSNYEEIKSISDKIKIMAVAPMIVQGTTRGMLVVGPKMNGSDFSDENLLFIEAIGNSAISALENERLFKEELEKKRIESELDIALEIQKNLLPDKSPELNSFKIHGISIPSRHVGGDLFDYIKLDPDRFLVAIADVSGKGIPASLIMANFQAALRVLAVSEIELEEMILKINDLLCHNTGADKFVTAFFCIFNDKTGDITYINAGHNPPILKRKTGEIEYLEHGGLILGFLEKPFKYKTGNTKMDSGDFLVLFTDGVTEAENHAKVDYGDLRLADLLISINDKSPEMIVDEIVQDVKKYQGSVHQSDDITLVVIGKE